MRCQSCGTQNETDSRFCGGCGARLGGTLAPTQKILDERTTGAQQAQPVPPRTSAAVGSQLPPVSLPGTTTTPGTKPAAARSSVAQQAVAAPRSLSAPPGAYQQKPQQPVARHPPSGLQPIQQRPSSSGAAVAPALQSGANPGMGGPITSGVNRAPNPESLGPRTSSSPPGVHSLATNGKPVAPEPRHVAITEPPENDEETPAVPGRRWGLIILVLILDLGLAAAGAWMLMEGLAEAAPASGNVRSEAPATSPEPAREVQAAKPDDKPAPSDDPKPTQALVAADPTGGSAAATPPPDKPAPSGEGSVFLPIDADFAKSLAESAAAAKQEKDKEKDKETTPPPRTNPTQNPRPRPKAGSGTAAAPVDPYQQEPGPPSSIGPQPTTPAAPPPS